MLLFFCFGGLVVWRELSEVQRVDIWVCFLRLLVCTILLQRLTWTSQIVVQRCRSPRMHSRKSKFMRFDGRSRCSKTWASQVMFVWGKKRFGMVWIASRKNSDKLCVEMYKLQMGNMMRRRRIQCEFYAGQCLSQQSYFVFPEFILLYIQRAKVSSFLPCFLPHIHLHVWRFLYLTCSCFSHYIVASLYPIKYIKERKGRERERERECVCVTTPRSFLTREQSYGEPQIHQWIATFY